MRTTHLVYKNKVHTTHLLSKNRVHNTYDVLELSTHNTPGIQAPRLEACERETRMGKICHPEY